MGLQVLVGATCGVLTAHAASGCQCAGRTRTLRPASLLVRSNLARTVEGVAFCQHGSIALPCKSHNTSLSRYNPAQAFEGAGLP